MIKESPGAHHMNLIQIGMHDAQEKQHHYKAYTF